MALERNWQTTASPCLSRAISSGVKVCPFFSAGILTLESGKATSSLVLRLRLTRASTCSPARLVTVAGCPMLPVCRSTCLSESVMS